jgi:NADH-quinone oxidoreductase subunit L
MGEAPLLMDQLGVILCLVICAMPLLSAVISDIAGLCRIKLPGDGDVIGIAFMGVSTACALTLLFGSGTFMGQGWDFQWIETGGTAWRLGIAIDGLTIALLCVVTIVSFLVHLFSKGYMHGDERYRQFYRWLGFFTFSMLWLVVSDNLFTLYVAWELMGLSSYKLIGHYFHKKSAYLACKKAFMVTRVGDIGMFLALVATYLYTDTLQFSVIFENLDKIPEAAQMWISLGLFMGAAGKSAQFPLHIWLPDAMEGPTPVSALIHAATMVAAGVYLVGRMYTLIALSPEALLVISIIGCTTALMAASIAFTMVDIKAVLAYSTISQLGFMFTALGVGSNFAWKAGLFHLVTHAFFKAGLFLGSGSVIHACHHEQDMTKMGGLWHKMPITRWIYLVCCLSIAGFPFTAGFFSKDMILQALWMGNGHYDAAYKVIFFVLAFAAMMTAAYMFRGFLLPFAGKPRDKHIYDHAHESPSNMTIPLMTLAFLALFGGLWWHNALLPIGEDAYMGFARVFDVDGDAAHHGHTAALWASSIVMSLGIATACFWYLTKKGEVVRKQMRAAIAPLYKAANRLYYLDDIVEYLIIQPTMIFAAFVHWFDATIVDRFVVDGTGKINMLLSWLTGKADDGIVDGAVQGTATLCQAGGEAFSRAQTGRVRNYMFGAVAITALFAVLVLYAAGS